MSNNFDFTPEFDNNVREISTRLDVVDEIHQRLDMLEENVSDPDFLALGKEPLVKEEAAAYKELAEATAVIDIDTLAIHKRSLEDAVEEAEADDGHFEAEKRRIAEEAQFVIDTVYENDPDGRQRAEALRDRKIVAVDAEFTSRVLVPRHNLSDFEDRTYPIAGRAWPVPRLIRMSELELAVEGSSIVVEPEKIAIDGAASEVGERPMLEVNKERVVQYVKARLEEVITRTDIQENIFFDQSMEARGSLSARITHLLSPQNREHPASALPALAEAGIVLQRGKMWNKDDSGIKIGRNQFVYRGMLSENYDHETRVTVDETPERRIEWEPIDLGGVEASDDPKGPDLPAGTGVPKPEDVPAESEDIAGEADAGSLEKETGKTAEDRFDEQLTREQRAGIYRRIRDKMVDYYLNQKNKYVVLLPERIGIDLLDTNDIQILQQQSMEHGFSINKYLIGRITRTHRKGPALDEILERLKAHGLTLQIGDLTVEVPHRAAGTITTTKRVFRVMKNYTLSEADFESEDFESGNIVWRKSEEQIEQIAKNTTKSTAPTPPAEPPAPAPVSLPAPEAKTGSKSEQEICIERIKSVTSQAMVALEGMLALSNTRRPDSRLSVRIDKLNMNGSGQVSTRKLYEQIRSAGVTSGAENSRTVRDMVMMYHYHDPLLKKLIEHSDPKVKTWLAKVTDRAIETYYKERQRR